MQGHLWTVHEHVLLARVAMHVDVELQILRGKTRRLPRDLLSHPLDVPDRRVQTVVWVIELAIEVFASHRGPVVASDHTVGIQHRNYFKDNSLAQLRGLVRVASQVLEKALHHPARGGLTRVHAATNDSVLLLLVEGQGDARVYIFELFELDQVVGGVRVDARRNCQKWHAEARQRLAQDRFFEAVALARIYVQLLQEPCQFRK